MRGIVKKGLKFFNIYYFTSANKPVNQQNLKEKSLFNHQRQMIGLLNSNISLKLLQMNPTKSNLKKTMLNS